MAFEAGLKLDMTSASRILDCCCLALAWMCFCSAVRHSYSEPREISTLTTWPTGGGGGGWFGGGRFSLCSDMWRLCMSS